MPKSNSVIALAAILIIIVAAFSIYMGLTYPRITANIPVSFQIGGDSKVAVFNQPFLDDEVQVQVLVQNGLALWQAQILSGEQIIWEHSAAQVEQQSYKSVWIQLPTGNYNLTFRTIGFGSLEAITTVTSKGGFWK